MPACEADSAKSSPYAICGFGFASIGSFGDPGSVDLSDPGQVLPLLGLVPGENTVSVYLDVAGPRIFSDSFTFQILPDALSDDDEDDDSADN